MEELSYKCVGNVNYPVKNRSENYVLDCDIRFTVSVQAIKADAAGKQKYAAESAPGQYLKDNMPRFMKEAMRVTWEDAIPLNAFSGFLAPMQETISRIIEVELAAFDMQFRSFSLLVLGINGDHRDALAAHETPHSPEEMEEIRKHMQIDEQYRPDKIPLEPGFFKLHDLSAAPASKKVEPWNCCSCGMKNNTSLFCPQCGAPRKESEPWICSNCGTKNLTGKFCTECGSPRTN